MSFSPGELERFQRESMIRLRKERLLEVRSRESVISKVLRETCHAEAERESRLAAAAELRMQLDAKQQRLEALVKQRRNCVAARGTASRAAAVTTEMQRQASEREKAIEADLARLGNTRAADALIIFREEARSENRKAEEKPSILAEVRKIEDCRALHAAARGRELAAALAFDIQSEDQRKLPNRDPAPVPCGNQRAQVDYSRTYFHATQGTPTITVDETEEAEFQRPLAPMPAPTPQQKETARVRGKVAHRALSAERKKAETEGQLVVKEKRERQEKSKQVAARAVALEQEKFEMLPTCPDSVCPDCGRPPPTDDVAQTSATVEPPVTPVVQMVSVTVPRGNIGVEASNKFAAAGRNLHALEPCERRLHMEEPNRSKSSRLDSCRFPTSSSVEVLKVDSGGYVKASLQPSVLACEARNTETNAANAPPGATARSWDSTLNVAGCAGDNPDDKDKSVQNRACSSPAQVKPCIGIEFAATPGGGSVEEWCYLDEGWASSKKRRESPDQSGGTPNRNLLGVSVPSVNAKGYFSSNYHSATPIKLEALLADAENFLEATAVAANGLVHTKKGDQRPVVPPTGDVTRNSKLPINSTFSPKDLSAHLDQICNELENIAGTACW